LTLANLTFLKIVFGEVFIPQEVKIEVVDRGKMLGEKDAIVVENTIREGWIKVLATDSIEMPMALDKGEEAVLSLANKQSSKIVLIDEVTARTAARLLGLTQRGTIFVLLIGLKRRILNLDEFLESLQSLINHGFRLKEEVYIEVVAEARRIAEK